MRPWKPKMVVKLKEMMQSHSTVALLDFTGVPSALLQEVKHNLKGRAEILMTKKSLIKRALEESEAYKPLLENLEGQAALLVSDENPFKIYSTIESSKMMVNAKSGQIAPKEIVVPKGGTGLPPGPEIGILQQANLPARIKSGQIIIHENTVLVKKGDEVSTEQAAALAKLDITPIEIQLKLTAAMEGGIKFTPDVLHVDKAEFSAKFANAALWAFNLAVETAWPTTETVSVLIQKASREGKSLAKEIGFLTADNVGELLVKAEAQAKAINDNIERGK